MITTLLEWLNASRADRERARQASLTRIGELDPELKAWVQVDPQPPLAEGPLSGIPFGAKDVFETRGLRTEFGSPIYKGRVSVEDAAIVRDLRQRGAVLLGKTHTAAFAHRTPAPTRNPRNHAHTPGGSSSGSAAAVAADMVPLALGTQTKGSVLRPASYCGVTGFKPTFGAISTAGVLPLAVSLDTVGFFTHTPADMRALWELLDAGAASQGAGFADGTSLRTSSSGGQMRFGIPDPMPAIAPPMAAAFGNAVGQLRAAGLHTEPIDIGALLVRLNELNDIVMIYEGARFHRERYEEFGSRLDEIAELVRRGLQVTDDQYAEAKAGIDDCRRSMARTFETTPVMLMPAATGPAPEGLTFTGDASMNAPWTTLGTPAVSVPMRVDGLPLGLQLVAECGSDRRLLQTAAAVDAILHTDRR